MASCNHFYGLGKWLLSWSTRNICRLYCFGNMVCPLSCFISDNSLLGYIYSNCNHNFCWRMDIKCYGKYWGTDPRAVVIDEYVGTWIPLLVAPAAEHTWIFAIIGFALFRIIDIFKPLGCRWVDQNVKGGWGVMLDDVLAGSYSLIIVIIIKLICFSIF